VVKQGSIQPRTGHILFMAALGLLGWMAVWRPDLVPGLVPAERLELPSVAIAVFVVVVVIARSMAFKPLPGTVISIDSGFYVAATLCFGSITAGRIVALSLTVDALLRLAAGRRDRSRRQWIDAGVYVAYFGGMSGALLSVVSRVMGADQVAALERVDHWRVLGTVVAIGVVFVIAHYGIQGIRIRLAGERTGAYVTRMGLPGVLAELTLLPLAAVVVFVYNPKHLLGIVLLSGTYVLIAAGFNRLSKVGANLRKRVKELETLSSTSTRLSGCLHIHQLVEAVASATTDAIGAAEALSFCRVGDGDVLYIDSFSPTTGEFHRSKSSSQEGVVARIIATDRPLLVSGAEPERGTVLDQARSWLGVPVRVFGQVEAVLAVEARRPGAFDRDDQRLLEGIAAQTSVALQNAKHYELAMVDGLTGLYVRRYFDARLAEEVERSARFQTKFSVAMVDIDDFKKLNDERGHSAGDAALREVARVIREEMRGIDTAARYGGEEFALVLPRTSLTEAYTQAERIRRRLVELAVAVPGQDEPVVVTASFGIAAYPESGAEDAEELLRLADRALYRAKRTGKNRVELYWSEDAAPPAALKPVKAGGA